MASKKVIAFFMHQSEAGAAVRILQNPTATESFVVGDIEEASIPELKRQGLIVQELESAPPANEMNTQSNIHGSLRTQAMESFVSIASEMPDVDLSRPQFYLIWLSGPLLDDWKRQLTEAGAELIEALPTGAYKIRSQPSNIPQIQAKTFVTQIHLIQSFESAPEFITRPPQAPLRGALELASPGTSVVPETAFTSQPRVMHTFDVRLHRAQDAPQVLDWLSQRHVSVAGSSGKKIRVYLLDGAPEFSALPGLPEVDSMEEYVPPQLHNDISRKLLHIDCSNPGTTIGLTGNNQIVAVADTGIDHEHPDLVNQIHGKVALGRPNNDTSDPAGHGTHVSGSIVGTGAASNGQIRGSAPGAKLYFQSLLDSQGRLGGLPLNLADLFEQAYQAGARIHNNSWGSSTQSRYTFNSSEVDGFIASRRDMLIVISAGNDGIAATEIHSPPGFVDWLSICSPASCKNGLTVGASRSSRTSGGYTSRTFGAAWPGLFPKAPIANEAVSGAPESLAAFSSRGPCDDRRIKPDVVAPGTDIVSTKSSLAPIANFWGPYPPDGPSPPIVRYAYDGGTSMAAPLVSGCAALVREYFTSHRGITPSAALLKATLINGTRWLSGSDSTADPLGYPNFHQGFGCIDMSLTVPNPAQPGMNLTFVDLWQQPSASQLTATGQRHLYQLTLPARTAFLRICLAYTDLPMRSLQNNLNLFLQKPDLTKLVGNEQLPNSLKIPDPDNNVESIRLETPQAGNYLIQVAATNLLKGPQDYALVVTALSPAGVNPLVLTRI
jgi:serine protease AprX